MDYIKQMMEDKGIEINEEFYAIIQGIKHKVKIYVSWTISVYDEEVQSFKFADIYLYQQIMGGSATIEKIKTKAKTLYGKLKQQGYGWFIFYDGSISKLMFDYCHFKGYMRQGLIFSNKSDAERELHRRKLEFEMQEFAREHNECEIDWGDFSEEKCSIYYHFNEKGVDCCSNWEYKNSADFDVYFTSTTVAGRAIIKFGDRMKKYYEWESDENE